MTFREEVTRACVKAVRANRGVCPACDKVVGKAAAEHAADCLELRDDCAAGL